MILMIMLFVSLIQTVNGSTLQSVGVKSTPPTVSETSATLTVYTSLLTQIPANGQILITLPLDMSVTSGTRSCSISDPSGVTATCTASQQVVTIIVNKVINAGYIQLDISNCITNPKTIRSTSTFKFLTQTSSGTKLDELNQNIFLVATEGTMQSASLVPSSDVVGATTSLDVIFKPYHGIPAGGFIKVQFPKWNPSASSSAQVDYFPGSVSCKTKYVLSNSLTCSYSNQVLTVQNAVSVDISALTQVAFTVTGFKNPMSTASVSGFTILTQDNSQQSFDTSMSGGNIDKTTSPTLQVKTPASLSPASIFVDDSVSASIAGIVQETNKMRVQFTLPVDLNIGCKVTIKFPSQLSASSITNIQTCSMFGPCTTTSFSYDNTINAIAFTSCSSYLANPMTALVKIDSLKLPSYTKATDSLSIYVSDSANNPIAQITSGVTYTATAGSIVSSSVSAVTSIVQTPSAVDISILPKHSISTSSRLLVTFSNVYTLPTSCSVTNPVNVNSAATCVVSNGQFVIDKLLSTAFSSGSSNQLKFRLNTITLPNTINSNVGATISYVLQIQDSLDSNYYTVDTLTASDTISLQNGNIGLSVSSSQPVAFAVSKYTFQITPQHKLTQDGYIQITYPSEISIPDSSYSQSQCGSFIGFVTTVSCSVDTSKRQITLRNGFRLSTTSNAGTLFSFSIPGIQNPANLQQTSTFQAITYDSNGNSIDKVTSGVFIQMTSAASMISASLSLGSYINAETTKYTFQMAASVPITASNKIIIKFPTEVMLPIDESKLVCTTTDTQLFDSFKCKEYSTVTNGVEVDIDLKSGISQVNAGQSFSLSIDNIKNPISTKPTSTFAITITDSSYQTVNTNPSSIQVATNTPHTLSKATITQADKGAAQMTTYTLVIYPENNINIGGGILIIYPSQVSIPNSLSVTVSSSYTKSVVTFSVDKSSRQVLITDAFQFMFKGNGLNAITISMNGFKNPINNQASSSFIVKTFNQETNYYYYIDQVTDGLVLNSACDYPCNTCDAAKPATCLSCYDTSTLNKLQGSTCVEKCSLGKFFNTATKKCEDCDSSCLGCVDSKSKCTSCGIGDKLYLFNNVCSNTCPGGYIADANLNQCVKCSSQCATCQNTASTCTSCNTSSSLPYFYKQTCLNSCPSNVSVLVGNTCTDCDTTCKTCSGTSTYCTSCESYMKFDQQLHTCIKMCNQGTQIYDDSKGICQYCNDNCATCTGNINTCTSCKNNLILNTDNVCRSYCNSDSQTPINNVCKQCDLPCASCKGKTNHCTKCANDYLLFNTTCVQYCPEKYEANNATGQCILVGLICPEGFTINEAGDGCIPNQIECKKGYQINRSRTACVPAPGSPIPFPFILFSICLGLLVLGSYLKDKFFTKVSTCLIALIGCQEMLIYMLIVAYSGALQKWPSFILSIVAVLMLMTSNIAFYVIYKKDICKDQVFTKWLKLYPKTNKYLPIVALVVNFKIIRMLYSGFFGMDRCMCSFEDPIKTFYKPLKMITYFCFIFVYIPIIVADVLIFTQVQWGYQLLILAIESFILAILIIVLTIMEFRQDPQKLFMSGSEQYIKIQPKTFDSSNVMGGIDMDESTLVRSRVADDAYEIQLRKKALATILSQVGKNFLTAQKQGVNLGGKIDKVMTKFDEKKLKLRRAFSLEKIKEEESWHISDHADEEESEYDSQEEREQRLQRRHSFPLLNRAMETVPNHQFQAQIKQIKEVKKRVQQDNVYAECKPPEIKQEPKKKKTVSRRTQTYLRELLCEDEEDLQESDLEVVMEEEAEIDQDYAKGLISNVLKGISDTESVGGGQGLPTGRDKKKKDKKKKKKEVNKNRQQEIPDFELADIMGEFEIDDLGNFIILRGERGELLDKKERRVNRRGYLVDRFGNVINTKGQIIFKAVELDSDDEIPAPFGFEKRKKNLLNMTDEGDFKIEGTKPVDDDEDAIERELKQIKKSRKKKRKLNPDGSILEEENDDEESSVDSLMADTLGKYQLNDKLIDKVTKPKLPKKKGPMNNNTQMQNSRQGIHSSPFGGSSNRTKSQNQPPKRIKRDDTRELFPALAVESTEQRKLFKIAESIGGFASQLADQQMKKMKTIEAQSSMTTDKLEKLKQEHFKDIFNDTTSSMNGYKQSTIDHSMNRRVLPEAGIQALQGRSKNQVSDKRLPPRNQLSQMEKIYGNVGDMVNYEEKQIIENMRLGSPMSSQITSRMGFSRPDTSSVYGDRRLKGLENIYLQKFDKKTANKAIKKRTKAKFRQTLNHFVDDPEYFVNDGQDFQQQNEMSLMVAEKLDKLQRQYLSSTSTNRFQSISHQISNPMHQTSQQFYKKPESVSGSVFNKDLASLDPVKMGNWLDK